MVATVTCPTCRRPVAVDKEERPKSFPFCCDRCRLVDFGAWARGDYVVAGRDVSPDSAVDDLDADRQ